MTSTPPEPPRSIAVLGTGLIGTSVALAAARAAKTVKGGDHDPDEAARAAATGALHMAGSLEEAVEGVGLIMVATPIGAIPETVVRALGANRSAVVTDAGSIKSPVARSVLAAAPEGDVARFVPGHPMGGSERSGPEHASASVVDGIVWVVSPTEASDGGSVARLTKFVEAVGARPVVMASDRHDRLVAFVSHLPQVASTSLMGLAATEEADEPDILLLAAGGFRDLTRLAASNPALWSDILLANSQEIGRAIDLFVERLRTIREEIAGGDGHRVEEIFEDAKGARLRLSAKPQVRSGVAVLQVEIPDEPGALARITAIVGEGAVNIEDLQIVHSPEGGRGTVHMTVAADALNHASEVLVAAGYDPVRLA